MSQQRPITICFKWIFKQIPGENSKEISTNHNVDKYDNFFIIIIFIYLPQQWIRQSKIVVFILHTFKKINISFMQS